MRNALGQLVCKVCNRTVDRAMDGICEDCEPGKCAECRRQLDTDHETGAHGDVYCTHCYRELTDEKNHGFY